MGNSIARKLREAVFWENLKGWSKNLQKQSKWKKKISHNKAEEFSCEEIAAATFVFIFLLLQKVFKNGKNKWFKI